MPIHRRNDQDEIIMHQLSLSDSFASKHPKSVERLSKHQLIYSIAGLVVGAICVIFGVVLFLHGVFGSSSWTARMLGAESKVSDIGPGGILFVAGLYVVFFSRYALKIQK
jgi:hypothetical protein